MGGAELVERQHSLGKLTVRERLDLLARSRDVGRVRAARRPHGRRVSATATSRPTARHRHRRDRRPPGRGRGVRLHRDGRLDGPRRRDTRSSACASTRSGNACRWCGCSTRPARASSRRADRRSQGMGDLFREQVAMSGVVPMVAAMLGHCAAGTAYIPALADFVPMVKGHVVDGARRSAPREGGGRRGRHRGGDGRLGRAHEDLRRAPTSRSPTTTSASRSCASTCRFFPQHNSESPPTANDRRPGRPPGRGALRHRADRAARARTTCARSSPRSSTTATCSG